MTVTNQVSLILAGKFKIRAKKLGRQSIDSALLDVCFTSLVFVSIYTGAQVPWDDPKLIIGIRGFLWCLFLGLVGKAALGSTPRPLEMLGGDQRFVNHPAAKSNSGEGTELVILTASLGICDATSSSWAINPR